MMFIDEIYQRMVADNEKNLRFWEGYLNSLEVLDLNVYAEKLKVPALVPVGSRIFFRGELKHTNEVTVALGADYFVKCSLKQAEVLRQHRIRDAQSKLDIYKKEKEYLENHMSFAKQNVYNQEGNEIVEQYTEEEDRAWRMKHKENVKKYMQEKKKEEIEPKAEMNDNELWERLEELELQEELENEMLDNYNEIIDNRKENSFLENEQKLLLNSFKEETKKQTETVIQSTQIQSNNNNEEKVMNNTELTGNNTEQSKIELLQQVIDKQNELENKLHELKYREREQSKTEEDLISKLDEMEQLDELEDEIDRLDDILEKENTDSEGETTSEDLTSQESTSTKMKKSISFADEVESDTIEITFKHSDLEPNTDPYIPEKGITKPSDIYDAYPQLFSGKPTSILKKSKYEESGDIEAMKQTKKITFESEDNSETTDLEETAIDRMIVVNDVVENPGVSQKKVEMGARPTSLFKQRRLQKGHKA